MSDRFTEKLRRQRHRRWWRIAAAVLVVLLVGAAAWAIWFSDLLAARTVAVTGTEHLSADRVVTAAQVPLGTPLPRLDTEAIADRVGALLPVESVSVDRDLPHTVRIRVTERTATAWLDRSGTPWAVDAAGVVYRPLRSEPSHLPELQVDPDDRRSLAAAAQVAGEIGAADPDLFADVQSISAETRDSVELNLTKGRTVVWGSAENADAKLKVLEPLLQIEARSYDVSAPERPTTLQ